MLLKPCALRSPRAKLDLISRAGMPIPAYDEHAGARIARKQWAGTRRPGVKTRLSDVVNQTDTPHKPLQLTRVYFEALRDKWRSAEQALPGAVRKGQTHHPSHAYLLISRVAPD